MKKFFFYAIVVAIALSGCMVREKGLIAYRPLNEGKSEDAIDNNGSLAYQPLDVELVDESVLMGMKLEKVREEKSGIQVVATGSEFLISWDGVIRCFQRIPSRHEVAKVRLPQDVLPLRLGKKNVFSCQVMGKNFSLIFQGDSLMILRPSQATQILVEGLLEPIYRVYREGTGFFITQTGGFGVYPINKVKTNEPDFQKTPWEIKYNLTSGNDVWISVFPPRPYNWQRAFEPLAHEGGGDPHEEKYFYPSDSTIRSAARYCDIFVVHSFIWPGGNQPPWLIPKFVPTNMEKFNRMRDIVYATGMKIVLYMSPFYYSGNNFFGEMHRVLKEYKVDGVYFDGVSMDFRKSYRTVRKARQILSSERILYIHCSTDPLGYVDMYCPFIDTYADYTLRGEAGRAGQSLDNFLRWIVSGYNISNAVGYWCRHGSTTDKTGYVYVVPTSKEIDTALSNKAWIVRTEDVWRQHNGDVDAFDREYYSKLNLFRKNLEHNDTKSVETPNK